MIYWKDKLSGVSDLYTTDQIFVFSLKDGFLVDSSGNTYSSFTCHGKEQEQKLPKASDKIENLVKKQLQNQKAWADGNKTMYLSEYKYYIQFLSLPDGTW